MPRAGRGGKRAGTPGTAYANRSDLREPVSTVPNQTYGEAAQQQSAQHSVPMAPTQAEGVSPISSVPVPSPPTARTQHALAAQGNPPGVLPGQLQFDGPTQRPGEPVTAGLTSGAGPGPEALTGVGQAGFGHANTAQLLSSLAQMPGATRDVQDLAAYAASGKG